MPDCAFCRIADGSQPARIVYEDDATLAFLPLDPATDGHVLVMPRRHVQDIWGLDNTTATALTRATLRLAHAVRAAFRPGGLNIINSSGTAATQTVMHVHVHVVPRTEGDRMGRIWPPPAARDTDLLDATADRLRAAVAQTSADGGGQQDG